LQSQHLKILTEIQNCPFEFHGNRDRLNRSFAGVSIDSRSIRSDEIFFAIKGENHDGHDYVGHVIEQKSPAVVVNRDWWEKHADQYSQATVFVVDDTLTALQEFARYYRQLLAIPVIALTGTNGKTTTKEMIAAILSKSGSVCKTAGNLNNHIGLPLTLFTMESTHKTAVLEMGTNHFGEIKRLCDIAEPELGLITNIGHGHTEFFQDLQGVAKAKMELFDYLEPNGVGFINVDDPLLKADAHTFYKKITFGFDASAKVTAKKLPLNRNGNPGMQIDHQEIRLNVVGTHNLINGLAAIAIGLEFGIPLQAMKEALQTLQLPSKRMQIERLGKLTILNDCYNANPESTSAALETLIHFPEARRRIFVFGDMLELGTNATKAHTKVGNQVASLGIDVMFTFGPNAAAATRAARKTSTTILADHFDDKSALLKALIALNLRDDILLIKGSRGMKMEEISEGLRKTAVAAK